MKIINLITIVWLLSFQSLLFAGDKEKNESVKIVNSIVGVCKDKGMLACQPHIKGVDIVFEYIRLFDQIAQLDLQFKQFLKEKYPKQTGLDFDVIQASLNLSLDITFTPDQFVTRITNATKEANGYDVTLDKGPILKIRKENNDWVVIFPEEMSSQFKQLQPYYTAGQLKRSILVYRMLEADLAKLTKDKLEANVSEDIAPILVALFGKEKLPTLVKWLVKDIKEVVKFYSQFSTIDSMKAHIVKAHGLS